MRNGYYEWHLCLKDPESLLVNSKRKTGAIQYKNDPKSLNFSASSNKKGTEQTQTCNCLPVDGTQILELSIMRKHECKRYVAMRKQRLYFCVLEKDMQSKIGTSSCAV